MNAATDADMIILTRKNEAVKASAGVCDAETARILGRNIATFELTNGLPHDVQMVFSLTPEGDAAVICTMPNGRAYGYAKRKEGVAK